MSRTSYLITMAIILGTVTANLIGQELPAEVQSVLKHYIGHWEIRNDVLDGNGEVVRVTKEEHQSQFVINDQIVEIRGFIEGHEDFRAFLFFNPAIDKYVRTTIDRSNNQVVMTAERDDPYRFTSSPVIMPGGSSVILHKVFETVEKDRLVGYLEVSSDGGKRWRRVYDQVIKRVK